MRGLLGCLTNDLKRVNPVRAQPEDRDTQKYRAAGKDSDFH